MLKIYGTPHSRAFRVIWLANEIGVAYEHIPVTFGGDNPQCREPWYTKLNPNARVPTIDDGGYVIWESSAINLYLADKYKSPLMPATPEGRGTVLQWSFFTSNDVEPAVILLLRHRVLYPPEKRDAAVADEAEKTLAGKFDILEGQLQRTPFLGGTGWNMADFMVACVLYVVAVRIRLDLGRWPRLKTWLEASIERPAALVARKLREN